MHYFTGLTEEEIDYIMGNKNKSHFGTALLPAPKEEGMANTKRECVSYMGDENRLASNVEKEIQPRLEDLSDYTGSDIVWVTCHANRRCVPKKVDDRMHIFSMMTPAWVEFERKKLDLYTLDGVAIILPPGQMDYLDPIGDEIPGCDGIYDDDGILMALMVGYNIYILNDIAHCRDENDLKVSIITFEHIINEAVRLWVECEKETGGE